jgi:hypothetical protein
LPYSIPDAENDGSLEDYIDEMEANILRKTLGNAFFTSLVAGRESVQKYMDVVGGKAYVLNNIECVWQGLKKTLKPYIYAMYLRDTYDAHTKSGIVITKTENSEVINPTRRIVSAYNVFARQIGARGCKENSLYGFLASAPTEYDNVQWKDPGFMNEFNL